MSTVPQCRFRCYSDGGRHTIGFKFRFQDDVDKLALCYAMDWNPDEFSSYVGQAGLICVDADVQHNVTALSRLRGVTVFTTIGKHT